MLSQKIKNRKLTAKNLKIRIFLLLLQDISTIKNLTIQLITKKQHFLCG